MLGLRFSWVTCLVGLCLGWSLGAAAANSVTECWDGSCLEKGWTRRDLVGSGFTDYMCREGNCGKNGWIAGGNQGIQIYTQCQNDDCFRFGWWEIERMTHKLLATIQCENENCLEWGWNSYGPAERSLVRCRDGNCRASGWTEQTLSGQIKVITCQAGGCFQQGWLEN